MGRWFSPKGDRWWRVWSCPDHLEGLWGSGNPAGRGPVNDELIVG
jgi:hypothetical protein